MADDPYTYPGTDVLRNRLEICDAADLAEREATLSAIRIAQLERRFIPGGYDLAHLQATHRYIFGDVYRGPASFARCGSARVGICSLCPSTSILI
jgi:cell filamentation protein